jgi:hypothetical protein
MARVTVEDCRVHRSIKMPASAGRGNLGCRWPMEDAMGYEEAKQQGRAAMSLLVECCKRNDEKGATELLHNTFPLLHVLYQAEVVRFLLRPTPGHEDFAKRVFGNVQHLVPYEAYAAISKPADTKWMR